ncbi:exodeoxyribonuclease VII large subunit [Caulobacter mirabilis]|uniref:Exodeoxyribonuclease 7 large subunit n=1 Tax=Caulobacter mirabilis TaxID=69666 RepID=A0A2D2B117_9CAUL|nr:exodeoxyribonuclease VII large subunit [Caulobacter mirabilis]ATQ43939.1 exodeoxyribonuclease VII large subunit [Caulobacter mirabilis]
MTDSDAAPSNAQAYSVSELAFALKRTLEDAYGFVRLRGELSKVTHHSSGHVYLTIKDDKAAIDGVVWKGSVRNLSIRPEQGMEVIVTGRITTFPAGSRYQIVIETMEAAGVGALLAQLERLKQKLHAEGLFAAERKRRLPSMPAVVGVITSPTGAVIRDILHRIRDRWPCRVIVWPVIVQGEGAAAQVAGAIRGFNAMTADGPIPRPDILIVARGGGSVEDLWAFNDETLARTVAEGTIPLISAVGHETDTTLIDYVSDRRAPTPTAAAEMATPVLAELKAAVSDYDRRLNQSGARAIEGRRDRLNAAARGLPRPADILALAGQRLDYASSHLTMGLRRNVDLHARHLAQIAAPLRPALLGSRNDQLRGRLDQLNLRLNAAIPRRLEAEQIRLASLDKLRQTLNPKRPPRPGFVLVTRADGSTVGNGADLASGETVRLMFEDATREAVIDGDGGVAPPPPPAPKPAKRPPTPPTDQGDLF